MERGFQNHLEGFCMSCRGGGEYLSSSQWWQRIAILLELSTILLFQSIFFKCNLVETRQGGQKLDTIWHMAGDISKSIWRTYGGEKSFSLISPISNRVKSIHVGCLLHLSQSRGDLMLLESPLSWRQLLGTFTDINLAQHAHKLALSSCLSSKIGTILCFLQKTWKWEILLSLIA